MGFVPFTFIDLIDILFVAYIMYWIYRTTKGTNAPRIIAELKAAEMIVVEGTLYPILTRQKNSGLLTYRWEESPQGPPRKYYTLTDKGRDYLKTLDEAWDELVGQIQVIRHGK